MSGRIWGGVVEDVHIKRHKNCELFDFSVQIWRPWTKEESAEYRQLAHPAFIWYLLNVFMGRLLCYCGFQENMTIWCLLGPFSFCERRWRESLLDKTHRSAIYYVIDWILYGSPVIKCCRVHDWMSEILGIYWSEKKIRLATWGIVLWGNRGGSLSKMDLAIMGGMKGRFSSCLILYGRHAMDLLMFYEE